MDKTLDMAREAGLVYLSNGLWWMDAGEAGYELKAFEALVRADERDKWMERAHIMILGEREACAKVCEEHQFASIGLAAAIRARGNT
jgi:hypothetical protein